MARLALSVGLGIVGGLLAIATAGAATPAIFGLGFSIGSVVGGIAGSLLFPPGGSVGPRLNDLQVSSSAPGNPIAFGYGLFRLGGQIIWAQTIQEHKQNQSEKGGPTVTTYDYTCSFAVSFGEGIGLIQQLWGDSQCLYDTTGTQQISTIVDSQGNTKQLTVTLYPGDEFQMPDPTIQSIDGDDVTPAFRGQVYAVFENLDLTNFGNRVPNMRALISYGSNANSHPNKQIASGPPIEDYIVTDNLNRVYYGFTADRKHVYKHSLTNDSLIYANKPIQFPGGSYHIRSNSGTNGLCVVADPQGFLWAVITDDAVNSIIGKYDPNTWQLLDTVIPHDSLGNQTSLVSLSIFSPGDGNSYLVGLATDSFQSTFIKIRTSDQSQLSYNVQLQAPEDISFLSFSNSYVSCDGTGNCYIVAHAGTYGKWYIWNINQPNASYVLPVMTVSGTAGVGQGVVESLLCNPQNNTLIAFTDQGIVYIIDAVGYTILSTYGSVTTSNTWPGANTNVALSHLILDDNSNVQECSTAGETGAYEPGHFPVGTAGQNWNPDIGGVTQDGSVVWTNLGPAPFYSTITANFGVTQLIGGFQGQVQNGLFVLQRSGSGNTVYVIRASDLTVLQTFDFFTDFMGQAPTAIGDWKYDPVYGTLIVASSNFANVIDRAWIIRGGAAGATLDSIVADLAERAGLLSTSLDLTAISDIVCDGYVISNPQSAGQCIAPLCQAYLFDLIESDFMLKAVVRGSASVITIPEQDLGTEEDQKELVESLSSYMDTPKNVTVTYVDPALDYQQGSQNRIRHSKTTKSTNQTIINLPFVMSEDDAIQLADKFTWLAELERQGFDINFWKSYYMLLDAADVFTFTYEGLQFVARMVKTAIGQNYGVQISGVNQDSNAYLSVLTGAPQSGFNKGGVDAFGPTILFLLDTTLMQDKDASPVGSSGTYFAFASPVPGNPGATLYQSSDGQNWNPVSFAGDHIAYAYSSNILGVPKTPWTWDYVNTLTVFFSDTTIALSSTSALNVLNGANGVLVGGELIQFQNATQNVDGSWTLSTLLRGRRGTEWACSEHAAGDLCCFPQVQGGLHRLTLNAGLIGLLQYYKAITVGASLNSGFSQNFTLQGRDVKPYAPVAVLGTKDGSGNLVIQWQRRTRIGAGTSIAGTWPVSEATENYDIVITDNLGVVKRTITVTAPGGGWSSPSFPHITYTAAQQTTDFGGVQSTYYFNIYQNSALTFADGTHRGFETACQLPLGLSSSRRATMVFED